MLKKGGRGIITVENHRLEQTAGGPLETERKAYTMAKVKVGVFGAYRGKCMIEMLAQYPDAELVAICDRYEPLLRECKEIADKYHAKVTLYQDFEDFFKHDMDAVVLSNYAHEHAPFAIRLLKSGRHVASEVLPTKSMAEAVQLVEAVEESGRVYAYLENYCYFPCTMEMRRLYKEGVLGEVKHAEGEYVHNCEPGWLDLTYGDKNHWRNREPSTYYCTHSLLPILHITGRRPDIVIGLENTPSERLMRVGNPRAESAMEIVRLDNGGTVKSVHGNMLREPSSVWYSLYGSKASCESDRWDAGVSVLNLFDPSKSDNRTMYYPKPVVDTALSRSVATHGGGDFYTIHYFIQKILGNPEGSESIDVYEALDASMCGLLAYRSLCNGNVPIKVPNFRNQEEREAYREDYWNTFEDGPYKIINPNVPEIPDQVYEQARAKWLESQKNR